MQYQKRECKLADCLVRGTNPHERKKIEDSYKAAPTFIKVLADRLEKNLEDKITESESIKQYMNTNWAGYQADNRGYRRAIRDVLNLIVEYK